MKLTGTQILDQAKNVVKTLKKWWTNPRVLKIIGTSRYKIVKQIVSLTKAGVGIDNATDVIKRKVEKEIKKRIDDKAKSIFEKDRQSVSDFDSYVQSLEQFGIHFRGKLTSLSNETYDIFKEGFQRVITMKKFGTTLLENLIFAEEEVERKLGSKKEENEGENFLEALRNTSPNDWYFFDENYKKGDKIDLGGIINYISSDYGAVIGSRALAIIIEKLSQNSENYSDIGI